MFSKLWCISIGESRRKCNAYIFLMITMDNVSIFVLLLFERVSMYPFESFLYGICLSLAMVDFVLPRKLVVLFYFDECSNMREICYDTYNALDPL
jgi:hypothetical protein